MNKSLLELQSALETGSSQKRYGMPARKYGFYDGKEYVRYCNWRKANNKSVRLKDPSFTEDLEYWRDHVDYNFVGNLIRYLSSKGYSVDKRVISSFKGWCNDHKYTHSNRKECLDLFKKYCNRRSLTSRKYVDADPNVDINTLFRSYRQRCAYDNHCKKLGFSLSSDRERYLSGIEEWKRLNTGADITPSELFNSNSEKFGFHCWCVKNEVPIATEEELLSALHQYRKFKECNDALFKSICWSDNNQRTRYDKYCKSLGFTFTTNPQRYVSEYQDWSTNVDPGPYVDWKLYFSKTERYSFQSWCHKQGYKRCCSTRGFKERYEEWKDWYENSRDPRYSKGSDTK